MLLVFRQHWEEWFIEHPDEPWLSPVSQEEGWERERERLFPAGCGEQHMFFVPLLQYFVHFPRIQSDDSFPLELSGSCHSLPVRLDTEQYQMWVTQGRNRNSEILGALTCPLRWAPGWPPAPFLCSHLILLPRRSNNYLNHAQPEHQVYVGKPEQWKQKYWESDKNQTAGQRLVVWVWFL